MAMSNMVEPNSRIKCVDLLVRIAGLDRDTGEKRQGGVAVQINLGNMLGSSLGGASYQTIVSEQ
jgi:predicted MFS family arabinose efflux permease